VDGQKTSKASKINLEKDDGLSRTELGVGCMPAKDLVRRAYIGHHPSFIPIVQTTLPLTSKYSEVLIHLNCK
jgi:hypothetical protein